MNEKIMLGSAQFGQRYGIASCYNKVSEDEVARILNFAVVNGIRWIDTAEVYGDAEEVLGKNKIDRFNIVSKTFLNKGVTSPTEIIRHIEKTLANLKLEKIYGILIHDPNDLIDHVRCDSVIKYLNDAKCSGLVDKIGVSVSFPWQADIITDRYDMDVIQIPCNMLDQRFVKYGTFEKLLGKNIEIHTRSLFLQGLLLMDVGALDPYFANIKEHLTKINNFAMSIGISMRELSIEYAKHLINLGAGRVIFGVDSEQQLKQIVDDFGKQDKSLDFDAFCMFDERFIVPSNWRNKHK